MRYVLLIIVLLFPVGCTSPDFDTSVQVVAWLKSLDPNAQVIEIQCTGKVEHPPGSGIWKEWPHTETMTAKDVLASYEREGLDWGEILARAIDSTKYQFPTLALWNYYGELSAFDRMVLRVSFRVEDLHCEGKALRSPPIQIGNCPNDTNGCDVPPMATDLPPPLPPPPGGGDF
ncbi:MAG: hypothetical protein ACMG6S_17485 [Byssovorax sp.]